MLLSPKPGILYGPVRSRRLGFSLGINLLPPREKLCTFDCLYCQYGFTRRPPHADDAFPTVEAVSSELEHALQAPEPVPAYLTFSGNGEPTTHPDFARAVDGVRALRDRLLPEAKLAILSNSTRVHDPVVRSALARLDLRIMKLDAGTLAMFRHYNRPLDRNGDPQRVPKPSRDATQPVKPAGSARDHDITLEQIVAGLAAIPDTTLQSLFAGGTGGNADPAHVAAWVEKVVAIRPIAVQIYTLDRDWPSRDLHPLDVAGLCAIADELHVAGIPAQVFGPR